MREQSSIRPLGLLLFLVVTTFYIFGTDGHPTPSPWKGVINSLHKPLDPPVFGVHLSQLPQQQANEVYKQSLDEINIKKVANTLADNYLQLQGHELTETLGYKNQNQNQAQVQVNFRDHASVNDQKKRSSLVKKPSVKTPQLLQTQARVVDDFQVKNKHPFALFIPADFAPIHSEEDRERSFTSSGSEERSHYKVKRDDHANAAKEGVEGKRRSDIQGASQEFGRGRKRRSKDLVRKYRYSTLELKEDEDDDRPDVFFSDVGNFDDFAKSFQGGSSFGGGKKVEGKFTPYSGEVDHGRQRHPGYSSLNSESHYSGHGSKHSPSHGASYEDHRSSNEHGSSNQRGEEHLSGHKSIYTDRKPRTHYVDDSHQEHGQRTEYSHSNSKDADFSNPRPSDVLRNPSHDSVDDHFQFEFADESGRHLRSSGKGTGSPYKQHGKFVQSHESHGSGVGEQYRYSLFRGDHESRHQGKGHYNEHSDEDKHHYRDSHHNDEGRHASSHHGSSHHGSSHHDSSHHDKTPVYEYKHTPVSNEESGHDESKSLGTITHYKPLIHHHSPIDHSRPHHGGSSSFSSFGGSSRHRGSSHQKGNYDGEHHSDPHPHSSPVVESIKQVFDSGYYEKLAESLVSKMNNDQLMSQGGKSGKRETNGHQFGHGSRGQYSPHNGPHSNPAPTSFSSFQNPDKPINSGEEKHQRPGKSHYSSPHFQITPNSISGPRHPPHFGSRDPNHNRSRSPHSNFNPQHLRNNPSHNPHLPHTPPTSFNGISTLMALYNSIPTVNWSNRPPPPPGL